MALIRANPVRHSDQASHEPEHGVGLWRVFWQGAELRLKLVHQPETGLLPELVAHGANFEWTKRALVGPSVMRAHHCGPAMQLGTAEKSLKRPLAHEGVIRLVVRPVLLRCHTAQVELRDR